MKMNFSEYEMSALDNQNSSVLPAVFYLNLHKPMLITRNILKKIQILTGLMINLQFFGKIFSIADIDISMSFGESGSLVSLLIQECAKNDKDSVPNTYPCGVAIVGLHFS